jgi:hypothetical protein
MENRLPTPISQADAALDAIHDRLLPVLAEICGQEIFVLEAPDPDKGNVIYGYVRGHFVCRFTLIAYADDAPIFNITALLGRVHCGYPRALRWLAINRSGNTVGFAIVDEIISHKELWVSCSRLTTLKDELGLRLTICDFFHESDKLHQGLRMWFPSTLAGSDLFAQQAVNNPATLLALEKPLEVLRRREAGEDIDTSVVCDACHAVGLWDDFLHYFERALNENTANGEAVSETYRLAPKVRPLFELRRFEEVIGLCERLEAVGDQDIEDRIVAIHAHAIYETGDFDAVLDLLRSATLDGQARAWFCRALACARMDRNDEAKHNFAEYLKRVGPDPIASRHFAAALKKEGCD